MTFEPQVAQASSMAYDGNEAGSCQVNNLVVQLFHDTPPMRFYGNADVSCTIREIQESSSGENFGEYFYGETADKKASISLTKYPQDGVYYFSGTITDMENGKYYSIRVDSSLNYMVSEYEPSDFPPETDPVVDSEPVSQNAEPIGIRARGLFSGAAERIQDYSSQRKRRLQVTPLIDVMVAWTQAAECEVASLPIGCTSTAITENSIRALINTAVSEMNVAMSSSGIDANFNLLYTYRHPTIDINGDATTNTNLNLFTNSGDDQSLRQLYGADMMVLIQSQRSGTCGIAWLNLQSPPNIGTARNFMYSVTAQNCIPNKTFQHEMGHNLVGTSRRKSDLTYVSHPPAFVCNDSWFCRDVAIIGEPTPHLFATWTTDLWPMVGKTLEVTFVPLWHTIASLQRLKNVEEGHGPQPDLAYESINFLRNLYNIKVKLLAIP